MRILIVVINLLLVLEVYAQAIRFNVPAAQEAKLKGTPLAIIQDKLGFIWIGTTDGLKRYDGTEVVEFRKIPGDSTSLSNNYASHLYISRDGDLWVGTKNGANKYDPNTNSFSRYYLDGIKDGTEDSYILSIHEDRKGHIWMSTYQGRYRLAKGDSKSSTFLVPVDDAYNSNYSPITWTYFKDSRNRMWTGNQGWISYLNSEDSTQFTKYFPNNQRVLNNRSTQYWTFAEAPDQTIWVGSDDGIYLIRYDQNTIQSQKLLFQSDKDQGLNNAFINDISFHGTHRIFISTYQDGLYIIQLDDQFEPSQVDHFLPNPDEDGSIRYKEVFTSFQDMSGVSWIATKTGLNTISPDKQNFQVIGMSGSSPLSSAIVKAIETDYEGNIWIGTVNGLNYLSAEDFDQKNYSFRHYKHDESHKGSIAHNNIFDIYASADSTLLVSTRNGLSIADINHGRERIEFRTISRTQGLPHNWVYGVTPLGKNEYWVSTYGGFSRMRLENNQVEIFNMDVTSNNDNQGLVNAMSYITEKENETTYWVGTFAGLSEVIVGQSGGVQFNNFKYDPKNPNGLSDHSLSDILSDQKGTMWFGTRNGLNRLVRSPTSREHTFQHFGILNGFINDVIQSIEEDDKSNLWIGTNKGIVQFSTIDYSVNNYTEADGVSGPGQVFRASHKAPDGTMLFGSSGGINLFHPDSINTRSYQPRVLISNIEVMGSSLFNSDMEGYLDASLFSAEKLNLKHTDKIIRIQFASSDYNQPANNRYRYRLLGFDEVWVDTKGDNSITFTNIPIGKYTLEIQASNSARIWSENIRRLFIVVTPPWWKTTWAYMLYGILASLCAFGFFRWKMERQLKQIHEQSKLELIRSQEREAMRKKNAADYHDELGHRLTKISLLIDVAQRDLNSQGSSSQFFPKLRSNVQALSDGVKDLIWSIDPQKDSLIETVFRLQEFGDQLFSMSNISFKTSRIEDGLQGIVMNASHRKELLLIFKEAMNNCLKYSNAKVAELSVKKNGRGVCIQFKDDGTGFNEQSIEKGYGLNSMRQRAGKLDASLSIESNDNLGTRIMLHLPVVT